MKLTIPHRPSAGMCPVNGIRDLVQWRSGRDWSNQFLHGLGQGGGFAYLRFNAADPPCQVYWGIAGPRQHAYLAELLGASYTEIENRTFKFSWRKAREALDTGTPPVLGPLDMFYLPFYSGLYRQRHIPIHYLLLVGYDESIAYVHDTGQVAVQALPLTELEPAWNVTVPGLGKRNRLVILDIPKHVADDETLIRKSIADQCRSMLHPPVSMVGIPAMEKVTREIAHWTEELGPDTANNCLRQVREYLNSPPDLEGDHLTAGRDLYIAFLEEAGPIVGLDFSTAIASLRGTLAIAPQLAQAIRQGQIEDAAACFERIAVGEKTAYTKLAEISRSEE
ncbi:MAG: DUF4872 domain-containing protein [Anaerolineae bacterium]|nr:DUF4872 domain-containing protein [Anaerolineae bacterium]